MLVTTKDMLLDAQANHYAVGAFNVENLEFVMAVIRAAEERRSPVIMQTTPGTVKYASLDYFAAMARAAAQAASVPVAMHLDHGDGFDRCIAAMHAGYTSVMIDGSHIPFEDNIAQTKKVVEYAHDHGVVVEAELGRLAGVEDEVKVSAEDSSYTRPEDVEEFVSRTGCDSLAIAIGTSHGAYKFKGTPTLRFDILEEVERRLPGFPIVLHGASSVIPEYVEMINKYGGNMPGAQGVPEDMLRKAAGMAVCKINIDSDLRLAFTGVVRKHFAEKPADFDPRLYLSEARTAIKGMVQHKIVNVLGCNNKA